MVCSGMPSRLVQLGFGANVHLTTFSHLYIITSFKYAAYWGDEEVSTEGLPLPRRVGLVLPINALQAFRPWTNCFIHNTVRVLAGVLKSGARYQTIDRLGFKKREARLTS